MVIWPSLCCGPSRARCRGGREACISDTGEGGEGGGRRCSPAEGELRLSSNLWLVLRLSSSSSALMEEKASFITLVTSSDSCLDISGFT